MGLPTFTGACVRTLIALLFFFVITSSTSAQQTHFLIVVGLGGAQEYTERFHAWATTLIDAVTERYSVPAENVIYLGEKTNIDYKVVTDRSTKENIIGAIDTIVERSEPFDNVAIVLFGHGSFTDAARINLPGRDLSATDFAELLNRLRDQRIIFVNTSSASGPFIQALSGDGRIVVTATKTGGERNAAIFGGHFVAAFTEGEEEADQNKDRRVSILEAFTYARLRVGAEYESAGKLLTEHALLDDNGDGEGTNEPDPLTLTGDGMFARTVFFTGNKNITIAEIALPDDPELRRLYKEQMALEEQVEELRLLRNGIDSDRYAEELEDILIELALKTREIRQLEETKGELVPR